MPFTLSHATAALPLRRLHLVTSALVMGTFAPDFEYFIHLGPSGKYGHTLPGIFLLTLPLALLTLWLFHAFVKVPLVELLPSGLERRLWNHLGEFRFTGAARLVLIVISALTGIATHIIWDSFTHSRTWLFPSGPFLHQYVGVVFFGEMPVYKIFQYISTVVGIVALFFWSLLWYRNTRPCSENRSGWPPWKALTLVVIAIVASAGATIRSMIALGFSAPRHVETFAGLWVATVIALLWWQLVFYGIWRAKFLETRNLKREIDSGGVE